MPGKAGKEEETLIGRLLAPFFLIPAVFLADRALKALVSSRYPEGGGFPLIPGVFHVTRVNNTGAAFGLFRNSQTFLIAVSALCAVFLLVALVRGAADTPRERMFRAAIALVAGGALGNLYDRLVHGYVLDFLDFRVWPVFNLADAAITTGVALMALTLIRQPHRA